MKEWLISIGINVVKRALRDAEVRSRLIGIATDAVRGVFRERMEDGGRDAELEDRLGGALDDFLRRDGGGGAGMRGE